MYNLNIFEFQKNSKDNLTRITEVSDKEGWKKVKHQLIKNTGI